ncbi:HlyD family secretion protein [Williamwhitmania taraxaci]|uniref:HlyD family secretion protein n=1 Tax=Williamwhitmania taraxaci TaxID=1640674 RepID=A0A1G6H723_9BACT|nr:efflux RND transporter periplasmic adaptor subunit [Williamwhitmania taraxaci]SDB89755.1 HlyD family secretion protein [Williamwhitmania taraxaci]
MKNRRNFFVISGIVIGLVLLTIAGWVLLKPIPLTIQGEVEAKEVKVASKLPGRIAAILVKEGATVKKGDTLILLDSPEIRAKMAQAQAAQRAAGAQRDKANSGARSQDVEAAFNMWQKAKAGSDLADKTYQRVKNLYNDGVVPLQKLDEAEANMKAFKTTETAAKAQYNMAEEGARKEDKNAASAIWDQASGVVLEVGSYLAETVIKAPADGEVITIISENGELVSTGFPIITLVDLSDIWVTFNLREDLIAKIKMGDEFKASFPALGNKEITLKINYMKVLGDFATWHSTKTSGDFDQKTFEVRAIPTEKTEGLRPGMSALVNWDSLSAKN